MLAVLTHTLYQLHTHTPTLAVFLLSIRACMSPENNEILNFIWNFSDYNLKTYCSPAPASLKAIVSIRGENLGLFPLAMVSSGNLVSFPVCNPGECPLQVSVRHFKKWHMSAKPTLFTELSLVGLSVSGGASVLGSPWH